MNLSVVRNKGLSETDLRAILEYRTEPLLDPRHRGFPLTNSLQIVCFRKIPKDKMVQVLKKKKKKYKPLTNVKYNKQ